MTTTVKTNGYTAEALQSIISVFNNAAQKLFGECVIEHFYYGEKLDIVDVRLACGSYGSFNISANRVSFNGHSCSEAEYKSFVKLTYNDECFKGELYNI